MQGGDTIVYAALEPDLNEKETTGKYTVRCKAYSNVTKSFIKKQRGITFRHMQII